MATASVPIEIRGRYFWRGDQRFLCRGVVYQDYAQPPQTDVVADDRLQQLEHDIGLFKELGLNAILVYSIDSNKSHDRAMKMLEEAGIYVLAKVGLSVDGQVIHRTDPFGSYTSDLLAHRFKAADVLATYPNCLGLISDMELINNNQSMRCAPVIRAAVRDIKRYLRLKHELTGQRILPVGYSASMIVSLERFTLDYLSAGDEASSIDFWSKNDYSWCSPSNMQISGYNNQVQRYSNVHIPCFFSEYGGNVNRPRDFGETAAMLSPQMTDVFSGGFAYEFYEGWNLYGLVKRVTGREALKWRRAQGRFETVSVGDVRRDMANLSLDQDTAEETTALADAERRRGTSRRLDPNVAEYRETSIGELLLLKDFMNLKQSLATAKDFEPNTDPDWADSAVTLLQAPGFPDGPLAANASEQDVPQTCVDWAGLEDKIRDEQYVLVEGEQQTTV